MSNVIRKPEKTNVGDPTLEKMQSGAINQWSSLKNHPLLNGRLIEDITLFTTASSYEHRLNRVPKGYFVVKANDNATTSSTGSDDKFIKLRANGTVTVSIWVF